MQRRRFLSRFLHSWSRHDFTGTSRISLAKKGGETLLVLLFLVGYSARYINPRYLWIAQALAFGLPVLSIGFGVGTVWLVYKRRWTRSALYLILCALITIRFAPEVLTGKNLENVNTSTFSLVSLNVGNMALELSSLAEFIEMIERVRPDIISLQEAYVRTDARQGNLFYREPIGRLLGKGYSLGKSNPESFDSVPILNPVLTRFRVLSTSQIQINESASETTGSPISRTLVEIGEQKVAVYNIHLKSFNSSPASAYMPAWNPRSWIRRARIYKNDFIVRAKQIEQVVELLRSEDLPYVITGDFNSTKHSWVYKQISDEAADAFTIAGSGWDATYPASFPLVRIDHVFVSSGINVTSARVLKDSGSDHLSNFVELSIIANNPGGQTKLP